MTIEERTYGWDSHVVEYFAIGTAITTGKGDTHIGNPTFTISLNDAPRDKIVRTTTTPAGATPGQSGVA